MKKKRRRRDEYEASRDDWKAVEAELRRRIAMIDAELAARKKSTG